MCCGGDHVLQGPSFGFCSRLWSSTSAELALFVAEGMLLWCIEAHVYAYDTIAAAAAAAAVYYVGFGWQPTAAVPSAVSTFVECSRTCICDKKRVPWQTSFSQPLLRRSEAPLFFVFVVRQEGLALAESN